MFEVAVEPCQFFGERGDDTFGSGLGGFHPFLEGRDRGGEGHARRVLGTWPKMNEGPDEQGCRSGRGHPTEQGKGSCMLRGGGLVADGGHDGTVQVRRGFGQGNRCYPQGLFEAFGIARKNLQFFGAGNLLLELRR